MTDLMAAPGSPAVPGAGDGSSDPLVSLELEQHRRELTAHCRRLLRCAAEAEDATQETLVRAWRNIARFEGRSSLRSWLYRIATNVCFDMLGHRQRRPLPVDMATAGPGDASVEPSVDSPTVRVMWSAAGPADATDDPAEVAMWREDVRLAFVTALRRLPARQRAVLILREVLRWQASEVAELLGTTVAAVNSALQRARATLSVADVEPVSSVTTAGVGREGDADGLGQVQHDLLSRYLHAFERHDVDSLVALLHSDGSSTSCSVRDGLTVAP